MSEDENKEKLFFEQLEKSCASSFFAAIMLIMLGVFFLGVGVSLVL